MALAYSLAKRMNDRFATCLVQGEDGRRSIAGLLAPLAGLPGLVRSDLPFSTPGGSCSLPRFTFSGPKSSDPIRIGIFAAIHGDEPAGAVAVLELLRQLAAEPELAENYLIHAYPVCNPTGFEDNTRISRGGTDLNRQFWRNSEHQEVRIMEHELHSNRFHGIIQLHADDTSEGLYGFVRGSTLTENLLRPALMEAGKILPRNVNALIDGFAARDGIIYELYEGVLAAPARVEPAPFEIILETPHLAPLPRQVEALVVAIKTILAEYRRLISFAQSI
jgi:murein peptide amidase A